MKSYRHLLFFLVFNICFFYTNAQSQNENYIKTTEFLEAVDINTVNSNSIQKIEGVSYFDGFGKTKQTVGIKQTTNQKDIIQHYEYDEFGRMVKQYLPLPSTQSSGNLIQNPSLAIGNYYLTELGDGRPFSEMRYDNSPLNRKLESASVGQTWQLLPNSDNDHTTKYDYKVNAYQEVVLFEVDESNTTQPIAQSYYNSGELLKNIIKNENWKPSDNLLNTKEVFTDKNGRKIAEFIYEEDGANTKKLSTYYVYDNIGNLRYVLPPKLIHLIEGGSTINYNNYSTSWSLADFLQQGSNLATLVQFSITNNILNFGFKKNIGSNQVLNQQTTKIVSVSPTLPDMFLGNANVETSSGIIQAGTVTINNGDILVTRTSTVPGLLRIKITVDLSAGPTLSQNILDDLAFQYKYDVYNRQTEQKVPGKDWEYMIYDQLDRPILTQDANLRTQNKWLFNKYDVYGRLVYNGFYSSSITRDALQTQVDNFIASNSNNKANTEKRRTTAINIGGVTINYTNNAFPNSNLETLSVIYFDDYNFTDSDLPTIPTSILGQSVTDRTRGLTTANWAKTLGENSWSKNYTFYDKKGRVINIHDINHLGGSTINKSKLDFRGKVESSETKHRRLNSNSDLTITDRFEYDHIERPKKHFQKINSQTEVLIAKNTYNELGQVITKGIGGNDIQQSQTVDYKYNIRGWLTDVNDVDNLGFDVFAYHLNYTDAVQGMMSVDDIYNGNIKQITWKSAKNNIKKSYAFEYDKLQRFKKSQYRENNSLSGGAGKYETQWVNYDTNGNITSLARKNQFGVQMDNLAYSYDDGNKLMHIEDSTNDSNGFRDINVPLNSLPNSPSADDYRYDINGNLTRDYNKDISNIIYNHLDLVEQVSFANGNKIEFTYDASGNKLQMKNILAGNAGTTTVDYLGGFQYTTAATPTNAILQHFPTPEGYVANDNGTYKYVYVLRDHLGNNRVSFLDSSGDIIIDPVDEILSSTDYYVMGLKHPDEFITGLASNYNYKYQGKEQLAFGGYNMYDFGSRMYDASVGRWFNTDPQNQFWSPYIAMGNNWVFATDPNGEIVPLLVIGGVALFSGIMNVASNWNRIDNFWEGAGHFLTGAGTGVATVTLGPAGGAAASMLGGALDEAIQGGGVSEMFRGGLQGGISSVVGFGVGKYVSKASNVFLNNFNITSPLTRSIIGGSIGGGFSGGLTGGLFSVFDGGNFWDGASSGAKSGLFYGGISSAGNTIFESYSRNVNPFTGGVIKADEVKINKRGVKLIDDYLNGRESISPSDYDMANDVMIRRLQNIVDGRSTATDVDINFYTHELREMYLKKYEGYNHNRAHEQSLKDYNIDYKKGFADKLYTPDALKTGDAYYDWKSNQKNN